MARRARWRTADPMAIARNAAPRLLSLLGAIVALSAPSRPASAQPSPHAVATPPLPAAAPLPQRFGWREVWFTASNPRAELQMRVWTGPHDDAWVPVCVGPCRISLTTGNEYRVAGHRLRTSDTFVLAPSPWPQRLDASVGSNPARLVGIALVPSGCAAILLGAWAGLAAVSYSDAPDRNRYLAAEALAIVGIGTASILTGIALIRANSTTLTTSDGTLPSPSASLGRGITLTPFGLQL